MDFCSIRTMFEAFSAFGFVSGRRFVCVEKSVCLRIFKSSWKVEPWTILCPVRRTIDIYAGGFNHASAIIFLHTTANSQYRKVLGGKAWRNDFQLVGQRFATSSVSAVWGQCSHTLKDAHSHAHTHKYAHACKHADTNKIQRERERDIERGRETWHRQTDGECLGRITTFFELSCATWVMLLKTGVEVSKPDPPRPLFTRQFFFFVKLLPSANHRQFDGQWLLQAKPSTTMGQLDAQFLGLSGLRRLFVEWDSKYLNTRAVGTYR